MVEDERAAWCAHVELVANRHTSTEIAAHHAAGFLLDGDPVVARPGWSGERIVAQQRPWRLVGLDPHRDVLTGASRGEESASGVFEADRHGGLALAGYGFDGHLTEAGPGGRRTGHHQAGVPAPRFVV